jgi:hypothetical protein
MREGLAMYDSPLRALVWLKLNWAMQPRGDSHDVVDAAEHLLLRAMSRDDRRMWVLLRGMALDFDEALELVDNYERDQAQQALGYEEAVRYAEGKPRKPFPWHMPSPREMEALRRRSE